MKTVTLIFDHKNNVLPYVDGNLIDGVVSTTIRHDKSGSRIEIELDATFVEIDWTTRRGVSGGQE